MRSSRSWGPCARERMAGRAIREPPRRGDGGRVSPGMEPRAPAADPAVRRASRRRLPVRTGHHDAGALATARGARASLAGGPYGAAHASHSNSRAHAVDGRPRGSAPRRPAPISPRYGAPRSERSRAATSDAVAASPGGRLDRVRSWLLGLARAGALRPRARVGSLAPRRAHLFPRERAAVLAARDPRVAGPDGVAALDDDPVPGPRDVPEPAAGHDPDVLRPRDLRRTFVRRRPGAGRPHHVGPRVASASARDPSADRGAVIPPGGAGP